MTHTCAALASIDLARVHMRRSTGRPLPLLTSFVSGNQRGCGLVLTCRFRRSSMASGRTGEGKSYAYANPLLVQV
ncbi:hypothetical protein KC330_g57 [Hortaea werneckii]|nr:hypothetical protein KC330_g57 [Hortaea werneckii]